MAARWLRTSVLTAAVFGAGSLVEHGMNGAWARPQEASSQSQWLMIVPTTHMDIDFTRRPDESMARYARFLRQAMMAVHEDPGLRYSVQLASVVPVFREAYPQLWSSLVPMVRDGRIEICSNWTNPHYSELGGETIVRQIAGTRWWLHDQLGVWTDVADNGELADVTPQLVQVLARSGVPNFHTYKIVQRSELRTGYEGAFWLVGLDGSRVLVNGDCYNHSVERPETRPWGWPEGRAGGEMALRRPAVGNVRLVTDGGPGWDDEMPPLRQLGAFVEGWNHEPAMAAQAIAMLATWRDYFAKVRQQVDEGLALPVRSGHTEHGELLYQRVWNLARDRALFESRMAQAEALAVMNDWLGLTTPPGPGMHPVPTQVDANAVDAAVEAAWRQLLEACTHNWALTDQETGLLRTRAAAARAAAEGMLSEQRAILAQVAAADEWVVINTLPCERRELVPLGATWRMVDVPAMGYVRIPAADAAADSDPTLIATSNSIENVRYRVTADAQRGLTSIFDKRCGRELLRPVDESGCVLAVRGSYNEAMGAERADYLLEGGAAREATPARKEQYRAWLAATDVTMQPDKVTTRRLGDGVELVIDGAAGDLPMRIVARLAADTEEAAGAGVDLTFESADIQAAEPEPSDPQLASLVRGGRMFFAVMELNVDEQVGQARASVPFGSVPVPLKMPAVGELPFSSATTHQDAVTWYGIYNEDWHQPLEAQFAARLAQPQWLTLWDAEGGVTWLQYAPYANMFRDLQHPSRFYKSLWRGQSGDATYRWRLLAHHGDWREARAPSWSSVWQTPLLVVRGAAVSRETANAQPRKRGWFALRQSNLVFSHLGRSFDGKDHVLRCHEAYDHPTRLDGLILDGWRRTNLVQEPTSDGPEIGPFEIVTLRRPHDAGSEDLR